MSRQTFAMAFLGFALGMLLEAGYRAATTSWQPNDCQMIEGLLGVTPQATTTKPRLHQSTQRLPGIIWRT